MSSKHEPLEALARAYDREDASQRGEPDPWKDAEDDAEWVSERLACAQVAEAAYLVARSVPEAGKAVERLPIPDGVSMTGGLICLGYEDNDERDLAYDALEAYGASAVSALASSPAPTGATESCGCVFRDLNVPCRNWECKICHALASPQPVAPTGEIAGLRRMSDAHREHAQSAVEHNATLNRLLSIAEARADRLEAEAADLRRKLEEHQDAEDKAAREMATVIQGLRNRATAAERKLEEARKALEPFGNISITLEPDGKEIAALHSEIIAEVLSLTVGDLRRARALSEREGQE